MTVQEVKKRLEALHYRIIHSVFCNKVHNAELEALNIAIESMKELEQYRALGTVEELKEAKELFEKTKIVGAENIIIIRKDGTYEVYGIDILAAIQKQIPKKPIVKAEKERPITHNLGRLLEVCCPVCGKRIFAIYEADLERGGGVTREAKGCSRCLQAIDFTGYYCTPKLDKSDEDIDWSEEE